MFSSQQVYYSIIGIAIFSYLAALRLFRLPFLTFSSVNYFLAAVLAMIPGYSVANGTFLDRSLSRGFDSTVYLLFIAYTVTLTGASLIAQIVAKRYALLGKARPDPILRCWIVAAFVAIYAYAYFSWLPHVPLVNLISGRAGFGEAAAQRLEITHQLGDSDEHLPFVFRYWRTVLQYWAITICFMFAFYRQTRGTVPTIIYYLYVIGTAFLLAFTLEKALLVDFLFGMLVIPYLFAERIRLRSVILIAVGCALISMAAIAVFMGGTINELPEALLERFNGQTSSVYVQIEYVREHGFLGLRGIQMPFSSWFLGKDYFVDLGREAYATMFPNNANAGLLGSVAGLSLADLYFAFGWTGVPIFAGMIALYSWVDIVWRNGFVVANVGNDFRRINGAFYVLGMALFSLTYVSSVFMIIAIPLGLSAQGILILVLYLFFIRIGSLRIKRMIQRR